jgi:hypothetical protein
MEEVPPLWTGFLAESFAARFPGNYSAKKLRGSWNIFGFSKAQLSGMEGMDGKDIPYLAPRLLVQAMRPDVE